MKLRVNFERHIFLLALGAGLPGSLLAGILLWTGNFSARTQWTLTVVVVVCWFAFAASVREHVVFPLRTFSNLLASLREGDFSFRMRHETPRGALGEVILQVNAMAQTLREQRLSALEATTLLRKVMAEIEVAVFAFDGVRRLQLVNRTGERLMARHAEQMTGQTAEELGLSAYLDEAAPPVLRTTFPEGAGLWGVRRTDFREHGRPHTLLVISNLTRALREEELAAWQRLVRVLGHEINNSLAPVKSISNSLADLLAREPLPLDWKEDARSGLQAIANRSEALSRFTGAYARLARLPAPDFRPVVVDDLITHVMKLETRLTAIVAPGPDLTISGDRDQLEQLVINILRNAVEAALETHGCVRVTWNAIAGYLEVHIEDDGPGLANLSNLFVPFFTTKPQGSGIGLVLSRQIAEAHGGELILSNRKGARGCQAKLRLPL